MILIVIFLHIFGTFLWKDFLVLKVYVCNFHDHRKRRFSTCLLTEVMVAGLQQVPWWRVDVNFSKARPYFAAHNLIQVRISLKILDCGWNI